MVRLFRRLQTLIGHIEQNYAFGGAVRDVWRLLLPAGGGGVTAYFAAATEWLNAWGPIAWVAAFFAGCFATVGVLIFIAWLRLQWEKAKYLAAISARSISVNLLDNYFESQRVRLSDFYVFPPVMYENKTFIRCHIIGPSNIFLTGSVTFERVQMHALTEFVRVRPGSMVANAIHLHNAVFRDCALFSVTVLVPENVSNPVLPEHLNWLTEPVVLSRPGEPHNNASP